PCRRGHACSPATGCGPGHKVLTPLTPSPFGRGGALCHRNITLHGAVFRFGGRELAAHRCGDASRGFRHPSLAYFATPSHPGEGGSMSSRTLTRREMIKTAAAAAAGMSSACAPDAFPRVLADASSCGRLTDIEHVVIFIQENRSFDHYFGSYRGVRGFSEPSPA